jgi:hypothetical protein
MSGLKTTSSVPHCVASCKIGTRTCVGVDLAASAPRHCVSWSPDESRIFPSAARRRASERMSGLRSATACDVVASSPISLRCAATEQWIASDSHNSLRPLSVASVGLGITPSPCAASTRLIVRQVMPIAIRVAAEKRLMSSLPHFAVR